ncbi:hypothetical protein [Rhizobium rhizogenes]
MIPILQVLTFYVLDATSIFRWTQHGNREAKSGGIPGIAEVLDR